MNRDIAISVEKLGKEYFIGHQKHGDLRSSFAKGISRLVGKNKEIESFWALRDINFEVKKGEAIGIIGRNGAGKSTLLKVLSRITEPTTGKFEINGRVSSLLEVGTGFHPELSGRENIFLNGTILGMKRAEIKAKFDEIVEFSGVSKFLDTPVKHYSSGMKVRLAFSVAAHLEPEILIVDEVLAVGDAEFQKKCLGKMDQVSKNEGRTVLFVSHNMGAVQNLCSTGVVLNDGTINQIDAIDNAIHTYLSMNNEYSQIQLGNRIDRSGSGEFKFENLTFYDSELNAQIETIASGLTLKINFEYLTTLKLDQEIVLSIGFFTQQGVFLFACRSDTIGVKLFVNKTCTASCIIPNFPLRKGSYSYNIIAYSRGVVLDHIQEAGIINVESGDFYHTGKVPAGERAGVLVNYEWK